MDDDLRRALAPHAPLRSEQEMRAAEREQNDCDIAWANMGLREQALPALGEDGKPLDAIFGLLGESGLLHHSGGVMQSPESTLAPSRVMWIGLNPGGDSAIHDTTLLDSLVACRSEISGWEEDWTGVGPGKALLQQRFKRVAQFAGLDPITLPATNAVFTRSRDTRSHEDWAKDRAAGLPVHRLLAETIQPDAVWFMGDPIKAAGILTVEKVQWREARHRGYFVGRGRATYAGRSVAFYNTPHLSRWDPTGKDDLLSFAFGLDI